jgi:hypothetical protein
MKEDVETLAEIVLRITTDKPYTRNSYVALIFEVWIDQMTMFVSKNSGYFVPMKHYDELYQPESITRAYRKLRETHPEIRACMPVEEARKMNEAEMKGINQWFPETNPGGSKQTILSLTSPHDGGEGTISSGTSEKDG